MEVPNCPQDLGQLALGLMMLPLVQRYSLIYLTTGDDAPAPKLNCSSCCLHILPALPLLTWLLPSFQEAARALPASQRHHLITFILVPHPEPLDAACWVVLCHLDTG